MIGVFDPSVCGNGRTLDILEKVGATKRIINSFFSSQIGRSIDLTGGEGSDKVDQSIILGEVKELPFGSDIFIGVHI